jgi:hypothetical protein
MAPWLSKTKLFFQKYGLLIFLILFLVASVVFIFISLFGGHKSLATVSKKIDVIVDKGTEKIKDIEVKQIQIEVEKNIKLENIEEKRKEFKDQLEEIKSIPEVEARRHAMIKLNKSIKVKNEI